MIVPAIRKATDNGKLFHLGTALSPTTLSSMKTATRQTALEPVNAGADLARSWSGWFRASNLRTNFQRLFNCTNADSSQIQFNCFLISRDNQSSVTNSKIRFSMFTDPSNFIYIQTTNEVLHNRYFHLVVTKSATEANTAFEIYLNGVRDTTATRNLTGTYTGALGHADLRFKVSHETEAGGFGGNVMFLGLWNKVLNQTEVTELYNQGFPRANQNASFYADIISDWPLQNSRDSVQNSNYNLVSDAGSVTHGYASFSVNDTAFCWKRADIGSTRYIAFGQCILRNSTTVSWYGRSGTSHLANGKIVRVDVDIATFAASAPVDVITDGSADLRGGSAGIDDNGHIHVFTSRYNTGGDSFINTGKYTSTDGGTTFGAIEAFATTETRFNFYGKHIRLSAGTFMVPFFEHDGTNYLISMFKTTDNWATHSKITVYSGTTPLGEFTAVEDGQGNMIGLCRRIGSTYGIYQMVSTDGGNTWDAPVLTNLGGVSGDSNCEIIVAPTGKLIVMITDRSDDYGYVSKENIAADVIANPLAWKTPVANFRSYTTDSLNILGYQTMMLLPDGRYIAFNSAEFSSSRADLYFGMGTL